MIHTKMRTTKFHVVKGGTRLNSVSKEFVLKFCSHDEMRQVWSH